MSDPFIRVATVLPFIDFLKERRLDVNGPLQRFGLTEQLLRDTGRVVHAEVVYGLMNELSITANDRYLGIHVGEEVRLNDWLFNREAFGDDASLGTTLISMVQRTPNYGSSVQHEFVVGSESSEYRVVRPFHTVNEPAQSDGLGVALRVKLFDQLEGGWDPGRVAVKTQFPSAVPEDYRGVRVGLADAAFLSVEFPTEWCHRRLAVPLSTAPHNVPDPVPPSLRSALEGVLPALLTEHSPELKVRVAQTLGLSLPDIENALRRQSTSLAQEIRRVRLHLAKQELARSTTPISEVAYQLGFSDAANFTRFFKNDAGLTPRAYRKEQQS